MATFTQLASGNWRVQVRRKTRYVAETFRRRKDGEEWALELERNIDRNGSSKPRVVRNVRTFGDLIDLHDEDMREVGRPPRRSKAAVMASLKTELGSVKLPALNRERLIEFGRKRAKQGAGPATSSRRSCSDGRSAWQRAIVCDNPCAECWRKCARKSCQVLRSLYLSWMRAGPHAILSAMACIPCSAKIRERTDVSFNQASRCEGGEPDPTAAATVALIFLGYLSPNCSAAYPPMLRPTRCAHSIERPRMTAAMSSTENSQPYKA